MLLWRQHGKLPEWKTQTKEARALILEKIADRIEENKEWLAQVETMDNGKPIRETSTIDIPYSIRHFRYYASLIRTDEGTASVLDGNMMSLVLREPIGVVGQIVIVVIIGQRRFHGHSMCRKSHDERDDSYHK